jgi:hypothetical protein
MLPSKKVTAFRIVFGKPLPRLNPIAMNFVKAGCAPPLPNCVLISQALDTIAFTSTGRNGSRKSKSWHASSSADNHYEIFIRADISDPVEVLSLLVKELVHTTLPDVPAMVKPSAIRRRRSACYLRCAKPSLHLICCNVLNN